MPLHCSLAFFIIIHFPPRVLCFLSPLFFVLNIALNPLESVNELLSKLLINSRDVLSLIAIDCGFIDESEKTLIKPTL
jgi:hypothetical protein